MHELSLCQNLLEQLTDLAQRHAAVAVARVEIQVGALSGVEAGLLQSAFGLAKAGTVADAAELITEVTTPRIVCLACGRESETAVNRLCCPACASLDTRLLRGHELILARVELVQADAATT